MNSNISPSDPLISLAIELKSQCNRYTNGGAAKPIGFCQTTDCLNRGGYKRPNKPDYSVATCQKHEQVKALESLIANNHGN